MDKLQYAMHCARYLVAAFLLAGSGAAAENDFTATTEQQLIETLRTASPAEKAIACKKLAIHGTKEAVPDLAKLLSDEQLASWARIALEAIPDPAADAALRAAMDTLEGRLLVGTINSIGVRRDANAADKLSGRLNDADTEVASAAAVALGHIGNAKATNALRQSLAGASPAIRAAVAEGCILCVERLMRDGKHDEAAEIYDEVRRAEVPKPRILEATRGAILARQADGIPLLVEQLQSPDQAFFQIGLGTARELAGREVADALVAELDRTSPERGALIILALIDREDAVLPTAILEAAKRGEKQVRIAAIGAIGRLGDAASVSTLVEISTEADTEVAQAAKTALASLPGDEVNEEIKSRLVGAEGKTSVVLIEAVGERRVDATAELVKRVDHSDPAIRSAALAALGETIGPENLSVLVSQVLEPRDSDDAKVAVRALQAACVRMSDREACAAELAAAIPRASTATKSELLKILGAMGGPKALETIAAAVKGGDEQLKDTGSQLLGQWMSVDAGPVLLELAKGPSSDKYQIRALRGYIRLARQFSMPEAQRAEMCRNALEAATRSDEQKLVLAVLERYPSVDTLRVAVEAAQVRQLRDEARRVSLVIAQQLGEKQAEVRELLAKAGLGPVKVEIVKAEYGSGAAQKDVTAALQQQAGELPLITLSSPSYNDSFGGDPAPGTAKQLTVQYRINGKAGIASFPENSAIMLPMPK